MYSFFQSTQTGCGSHSPSHSVDTRG